MELTTEEQITLNYYQNNSSDWLNKHQLSDNLWQDEYRTFVRLLPAGSIIDIGCDIGRDAHVFSGLGYQYSGVDISEAMIIKARKINPNLTFEVESIYNLNKLSDKFDGFICRAVLVHIPKNRLGIAIDRIRSVIKRGAIGWITVKIGNGEKIITDWRIKTRNNKRLWSFYQQDELTKILVNHHFEIIESYRSKISTDWLIYFVKNKE